MHLTRVKETPPLLADVTLVDVKHVTYYNEIHSGMDLSEVIWGDRIETLFR